MTPVVHIASRNEIPAGQNFVLVKFGEKLEQKREDFGFSVTVPRTATSELSFIAAIHSARGIAKREKIATVYACK